MWAGGVKAPGLVADSGLPTGHNGRLKVDQYLRVLDHPEIYAAGDLASVTDPRTGHVLPPLAQVALEEGETVARNLDAELKGQPLEAFSFRDKGFVVSVGPRRGVADIAGITTGGRLAHLLKDATISPRCRSPTLARRPRGTPTSWWSAGNTTSTVTAVTDTAGNAYQLAVPTVRGNGVSQAIYYAPNIKAAAAGANTVTTTFNTATPFVDVRALEYSGLGPFDVGTSAAGTGASANSGTVNTTSSNALIVGAGPPPVVSSRREPTSPPASSPPPTPTSPRTGSAPRAGPYSATAPVSGAWVMQVAAFRAAATGGGDTTPPTVALTAPPPGPCRAR